MRILIALPGLHRYNRGAEIAFIAVARELARAGDAVTLIGSGQAREATPYRFLHSSSIRRESFEAFPSLPILRNLYCYEELTFVPHLLWHYRPGEYDVTVTCGYPFINWILRRPAFRGSRPRHVFVTHTGDWAAYANRSEFRFFGCDGLICINLDYFERNKDRWNCRLIPNGVDCDRFQPGPAQRQEFGLPEDRPVVLMVSALYPNKLVEVGIEAVSLIPDAHLVVAGDGPLRNAVSAAAARLLPGRFTRLLVAPERMPMLYQSADVFLHCSKEESFPLVFLEAMACGLPVVANDMPLVRWIVGKNDEFLVNMDDPGAIADCIQRARHSTAAGRRQRVNTATELSWPKVAGMYRQFFQEIISSRP